MTARRGFRRDEVHRRVHASEAEELLHDRRMCEKAVHGGVKTMGDGRREDNGTRDSRKRFSYECGHRSVFFSSRKVQSVCLPLLLTWFFMLWRFYRVR